MLDSGAVGPGFKSQSRNSLRQTVHTHRASVHQAAKLVAALVRVASVCMQAWRKVMAAGFMTHVTCRLTVKISSGTLRSVLEYGLPFFSLN